MTDDNSDLINRFVDFIGEQRWRSFPLSVNELRILAKWFLNKEENRTESVGAPSPGEGASQ